MSLMRCCSNNKNIEFQELLLSGASSAFNDSHSSSIFETAVLLYGLYGIYYQARTSGNLCTQQTVPLVHYTITGRYSKKFDPLHQLSAALQRSTTVYSCSLMRAVMLVCCYPKFYSKRTF